MGIKVLTSKSTEVNIHYPGSDDEETSDSIPYQFETVLEKGKLITKPAESI